MIVKYFPEGHMLKFMGEVLTAEVIGKQFEEKII